jgi:hypothetical protein
MKGFLRGKTIPIANHRQFTTVVLCSWETNFVQYSMLGEQCSVNKCTVKNVSSVQRDELLKILYKLIWSEVYSYTVHCTLQ